MHAHGGPDVVSVDEVPPPRPPRGDELLVEVAASSVNGSDLGLRRGGMRVLSAARLPVRSGPKLDQVRAWGAAEVVDRRSTHVADLDDRWDVVLDAHGGSRYADLRRSLSPGGVVVSTRPLSPDLWRAAPTASPRRGRWSGFAVVTTRPRSHDLAHLLDLVAREVLVAPVDSAHPVERVREAHRRAETDAAGKVVLRL